ncbi:FAD-binding oxidoreductase [Rhodovastum atsumiense]|uniref:FAD-binding oxidoreductase n=1 Tax=Rhodovastum atsumiense TaxID=504468 RepID=A0A5M6ILV0_9PROT|nr:FAD-dependent oxidoreductase [Rhodovastum atsumiense]KAA5609263.1 FAD-binding oxidoreductase [Rhodovastum atsumiense]CAH2601719.1 FAD-binding oxidoreductase [Rhodovastum atsumiense]
MPQTDPVPWPPSLWAAVTPSAPDLPVLEGEQRADVVVIGAGFTGLSTALHLAEAGTDVLVVEAMAPGWGASGRNNGQVIPTLTRMNPDDLVARYGGAGERFAAMLGGSADLLFETVRRCDIAAEAEQTGWVQPAHSPGRMRIAETRVRQWERWGAPVELLDRMQMRNMMGSGYWHGGFWNRSGGHINPLALARGLAAAVLGRGGRICVRSPVLGFDRVEGNWIVRGARGTVRARALVLASNAYTGELAPALAPAVAREVVPVHSWQMATAPVDPVLRRTVIPGRQAMSDTHGDLYFARWDARDRLVTGGALILPVNAVERLQARIATRLARIWPQLGTVRFDYVWNGYIGMTPDYAPRFHELGPDAWGWTGCNGRAVSLAIAIGREFARLAGGTGTEQVALPFGPPTPLPLHGLLRRVAPLKLLEYRWRDAREIA